jgi:hypothetical protein
VLLPKNEQHAGRGPGAIRRIRGQEGGVALQARVAQSRIYSSFCVTPVRLGVQGPSNVRMQLILQELRALVSSMTVVHSGVEDGPQCRRQLSTCVEIKFRVPHAIDAMLSP